MHVCGGDGDGGEIEPINMFDGCRYTTIIFVPQPWRETYQGSDKLRGSTPTFGGY